MSSAEEAKPEQQQPEAEMEVDASKKRELDGEEEQQAAGGGDGQPAAKAQKTEGEGTAEAGEAPAAEAAPAEPVQIGYKAFATGKDAQTYFQGLVSKLRKYQNLNEVRQGWREGRWSPHAAAALAPRHPAGAAPASRQCDTHLCPGARAAAVRVPHGPRADQGRAPRRRTQGVHAWQGSAW
jgi:hypothetical protein